MAWPACFKPGIGIWPHITRFACCHGGPLPYIHFCLPGSIYFIFSGTSPNKDCEMPGTVKRLWRVIRRILLHFCPDNITEAVDWALQPRCPYPPTYGKTYTTRVSYFAITHINSMRKLYFIFYTNRRLVKEIKRSVHHCFADTCRLKCCLISFRNKTSIL